MMDRILLDTRVMKDSATTHEYLKDILGLPEYYGGNLDALYDCLTDMTEVELVFTHCKDAGSYYQKVYRTAKDAESEGRIRITERHTESGCDFEAFGTKV